MGSLQEKGIVERYHKGRAALIEQLGGKCVACGTKKNLHFHHTRPRSWIASKTSRWVRLARYRREAMQGLVVLRCKKCNGYAGKPAVRPL